MTDQPGSTVGFGHGKVILLGEHAVVHGQPAIVAGMRAGVRAVASAGSGRMRIPAWGVDVRAGDGSPVGTALARILERLRAPALDFDLDAEIPCRAGLGSSAAMAVAIARAAAAQTGASEGDVAAAVDESERVFHATPSGIDAAAALRGRVGRFSRERGWEDLPVRQKVKLCVGLSGKPRNTAAQVEAVGRLVSRTPAARTVVETIGVVTEAGVAALAGGDIDTLGRLFDLAHGLLAALRVSSAELDTLVHAARAAGAIGAKLTGAGGGGAVIAIAPSHTRDVIARWRTLGFEGFETVVHNA